MRADKQKSSGVRISHPSRANRLLAARLSITIQQEQRRRPRRTISASRHLGTTTRENVPPCNGIDTFLSLFDHSGGPLNQEQDCTTHEHEAPAHEHQATPEDKKPTVGFFILFILG